MRGIAVAGAAAAERRENESVSFTCGQPTLPGGAPAPVSGGSKTLFDQLRREGMWYFGMDIGHFPVRIHPPIRPPTPGSEVGSCLMLWIGLNTVLCVSERERSVPSQTDPKKRVGLVASPVGEGEVPVECRLSSPAA